MQTDGAKIKVEATGMLQAARSNSVYQLEDQVIKLVLKHSVSSLFIPAVM